MAAVASKTVAHDHNSTSLCAPTLASLAAASTAGEVASGGLSLCLATARLELID